MANLTSTTVTGTLNTTSTITGPGSGVSAINASNVSSGTLSADRLPTVPTTKGGTGLTSVGTSGQFLAVSAPGALAWCTLAAGGGGYKMTTYTSPATWTCPADVKDLKVTVVGAGGGAGGQCQNLPGGGGGGGHAIEYIDGPAITSTVAVTVGQGAGGTGQFQPGCPGGTSSFGAFLSATGGQGGCRYGCNNDCPQGQGGSGSGGQINGNGGFGVGSNSTANKYNYTNGGGGGSILTAAGSFCGQNTQCPADSYFGPSLGGGSPIGVRPPECNLPGSAGRVIVEEFF